MGEHARSFLEQRGAKLAHLPVRIFIFNDQLLGEFIELVRDHNRRRPRNSLFLNDLHCRIHHMHQVHCSRTRVSDTLGRLSHELQIVSWIVHFFTRDPFIGRAELRSSKRY